MIQVSGRYGWRPEPQSLADTHWGLGRVRDALQTRAGSGAAADLRSFSVGRQDQRTTNSCVTNAIVKALEILRVKKYGAAAHVDLSRLALYYLARELMLDRSDGTRETAYDEGTFISLGADCLRRFGVCTEAAWPFDLTKVVDTPEHNVGPTWRAMRQAYVHKIDAWYRVQSLGTDRVAEVTLALRAGYPVVFGTAIGDNWFHYQAGEVLRVPAQQEGAHATCLVGWLPDEQGGVFVGENSWNSDWGDDGFYLMAPEVIADWASNDFVVLQAGVEGW
jgi:C1A family cysteine protease